MKLLSEFQKECNQWIEAYINEKSLYVKSVDEQALKLLDIIHEFIGYGGKRFRPGIFFYSYISYSDSLIDVARKLSIVFELFHTFGLVHDDIIDNSYLRRGRPTVHTKYDVPTALMVGDYCLMLTDELFYNQLVKFRLNEDELQMILTTYNEYKQEVLLGEYLDYIKIADHTKISILKTAYYSFIRPMEIALLLAKVDRKKIGDWKDIMKVAGLIFQIKDDYIGTFGDEEKIGKSVTSDIAEGKNTLITSMFEERATQEEKHKFQSFFGKTTIQMKDFEWYINTLNSHNINTDIEAYIKKSIDDTVKNLNKMEESKLKGLMMEVLQHISDFSFIK